MPDVGMLLKLGQVLHVTVDEILEGQEMKRQNGPYEGSLVDLMAERAQKKITGLHISPLDVLGVLLFICALLLAGVQAWYWLRGRSYGLVYLTFWIPCVMTGAAVLFLWLGGICIRRLRRIWKKPGVIAAAGVLFAAGIAVCAVSRDPGKEILSIAPDFSNIMCLKVDDNGRAVFYRQRGVIFATQSDVFPFTVRDAVKIQWLEDDVCALTYESDDDGGTHQYVAAYGDRNGAATYYYVFNAAYGSWRAEGDYGDYTLEVGSGPDAGIDIRTPEGSEHYDMEECLQYGTLALVFPSDGPRWTLVLNKDCVVGDGGSAVEEGGTLTLCRVGMDKTAPLIMH